MKYNERGEELPDDTPIELPLRFRHPPSLQEQIRSMIRTEVSVRAASVGMETFEEADDFDVDDENELQSPHELSAMQEDFRLPDPDAKVLDNKVRVRYDERTPEVKVDSKESGHVQQSGTGGDGQGSGVAGEKPAKVGG